MGVGMLVHGAWAARCVPTGSERAPTAARMMPGSEGVS